MYKMRDLEVLYRDIIKRKGLVDSGKFYKSIKIDINTTKNTIYFDITGVDYGIYLQEDIINDFINDERFQEALLNILLTPFNDVDNVLEGKVSFIQRLFVRYNKKTIFSHNI